MKIHQFARAAIASAILSASAIASAAPVLTDFTVTALSFVFNPNLYGTEKNKLDVAFQAAAVPNMFQLSESNPSRTFDFGTIDYNEECVNPFKDCANEGNEMNNLFVDAVFTFSNPLTGNRKITAQGIAIAGPSSDSDQDFSIDFGSTLVNFGDYGQFRIDMTDVSFSGVSLTPKTVTATITLLNSNVAPIQAPTDLPEPGSLALLGLGLAGFAVARRRAAK